MPDGDGTASRSLWSVPALDAPVSPGSEDTGIGTDNVAIQEWMTFSRDVNP